MEVHAAHQPLRQVVIDRLGLTVPNLHADRLNAAALTLQEQLGERSPEAMVASLRELPCDSPAWQQVIACITVGETRFYREREWFRSVEQQVLEPLIAARRRSGMPMLRIWSAGCATGEEPYTLAMALDRLLPDRERWNVRILATDINTTALASARAGVYGTWSLRELEDDERMRYFMLRPGGAHALADDTRRSVEFRFLNLHDQALPDPESGLTAFDLILCRNVLMYFVPAAQRQIAAGLRRCLIGGGWIAVSPADATAEWFAPLAPVNLPGAIFFHDRPAPAVAKPRPASPAMPEPAPIQLPLPRRPEPTLPKSREARLRDAVDLASQGDLPAAQRECDAALAANSLDFDANLLMTAICEERGDREGALTAARRAIYINPESAEAHFRLGCILFRAGRGDTARRAMQTALRLCPELPDAVPLAAGSDMTAGYLRRAATSYLEGGAHG
jgi:chemotaxis protein methyltransferase CheR